MASGGPGLVGVEVGLLGGDEADETEGGSSVSVDDGDEPEESVAIESGVDDRTSELAAAACKVGEASTCGRASMMLALVDVGREVVAVVVLDVADGKDTREV